MLNDDDTAPDHRSVPSFSSSSTNSESPDRWDDAPADDLRTDVLLTLRDIDDQRDGRSRFGYYLARNRDMFRTGDGTLTADPVRFASLVFQIGSPPVMQPPYIGTHPRAVRAYPLRDRRARRALVVELALPTPPAMTGHLPVPHHGWDRDPAGWFRAPADYDRATAYVRLTVGVPIRPELLPDPRYDDRGAPDLDTARHALRALTTHVSAVCAHLVGALDHPTYPH